MLAARAIQNAIANCVQIQQPARGLFVLALQQVVDSFLVGLLTEEAFAWMQSNEIVPTRLRVKPTDPRSALRNSR